MRRIMAIVAAVMLAGTARAAPADHIKAAEAFVKAALGDQCDMNDRGDIPVNAGDQDGVSHFTYTLTWRPSWANGKDPPQTTELYQMFCTMGAYNIQYAFLLRDPDSDTFQLLSFARPNSRFDYTDNNQTALKSPPTVIGFAADPTLPNAIFDPKTQTLSSHASWRGLDDVWSGGQWRFEDGDFILKRFEVDPTYDSDAAPGGPSSYVVYQADR